MTRLPFVLIGIDYWKPLIEWIYTRALEEKFIGQYESAELGADKVSTQETGDPIIDELPAHSLPMDLQDWKKIWR